MKLAIVGSRGFSHYNYLDKSIQVYFPIQSITGIVSGGAIGADALGKRFATDHKLLYTEYPADWNKHGKAAGYIRNVEIVNNCDVLIAYWDAVSKGTRHSINIARKTDKPTLIFLYAKQQIITFNWESIIGDAL